MKIFWGLGVPTLLFSACFRDTVASALRARRMFGVMVVLALVPVLSAVIAKAQDSFSAAESLPSAVFGSITNSNASGTPVSGLSIAGYPSHATLWYAWTAPQSGEVEMDTMGSADTKNNPLDTVMAVYTGSSLSTLTQVAANDDLYPFPQENEIYPENIFDVNPTTDAPQTNGLGVSIASLSGDFYEYYSGPSGLRFNAVGNQTYYIAVDSKATPYDYNFFGSIGLYPSRSTGPIVLTWAYKPSGVFRFATENFDFTGNENSSSNSVLPPLIVTSQTETSFESEEDLSDHGWVVNANQYDIQLHSYYYYNVEGVPVTITRVGGSSGRVWLNYSTEDGNTNLILNGDQPAKAGRDYVGETNQTLIFDDGEMSKTIYVPIIDNSVAEGGTWHPNRDFTINLTGAQLDPYEDGSGDEDSVSPPRIDSNFGQVEVRILDVDIDPKGPSETQVVTTNTVVIDGTPTNELETNIVWNIEPTNAVLNFAKANYRFPRDVTNFWDSAGGAGTLVTVYVTRRGTNAGTASANWIVNSGFLSDINAGGGDHIFPLQPASDYADPDPPSLNNNIGTNSDFDFNSSLGANSGTYQGTVTWAANNWDPQPIQFLVYDNGNVTLDKDFIIDLYQLDKNGFPSIQPGMVAQTTVTILANRTPATGSGSPGGFGTSATPADGRIPAGSVDENYNADFGLFMAPSINTSPQNNAEPGAVGGQVNGLVVLTNNETLVVGSFQSYNGQNEYGICLIQTNGDLDASFNPGSGVNVVDGYGIDCVAMTPNDQQFVIGGSFTTYNGSAADQASGIARVNLNGSRDATFAAWVSGNSSTVYAVAVQPNGQVLIGGDFTEVDGQSCPYVARLNSNGSLDTTFNSGSLLGGPVYALSVRQTAFITTNVVFPFTNIIQNVVTANVNSNNAGSVIVNYLFPTTNEMQVYYGNSLIYDTGPLTTGGNVPAQFTVPYGPGSAPIYLVANPGGSWNTGTNYSYGAVITSAASMPEVMVGGDFSVANQNYANIALLNTNGGVDTSFAPTVGADQPIYAIDWQPDGKVLIGGDFQNYNATNINRFARLNADGTLDTTNFYVGAGADDTVMSIKYLNPYNFYTFTNNPSGYTYAAVSISRAIYIGGLFSSYNGTRRWGFARLYTDGTVDTTFMDSTYNQFAGLPKIYSYDAPFVDAIGVQSDGNVMIGGSFDEVGGGEADMNPCNEIDEQRGIAQSFANPWLLVSEGGTDVEPNARDGVRNRSGVARLVGGATPGPGNLVLLPGTPTGYQANRNQVTQPVSLVRTNGFLGPESANFSIVPGTAQSGSDLVYQSAPPIDYLAWEYAGPTRDHSDGLFGDSGFLSDEFNQIFSGTYIDASEVNVTILPDVNVAGNLTATYQLANPANADQLYLGGEDIPVGNALGFSSSPASFVDVNQSAGTIGFVSSTFIVTNLSPVLTVIRTNGTEGTVTVNYSTNSPNGGNAVPNVDYNPIPISELTFVPNQTARTFNLSILNNGIVYTNYVDKTINLKLSNLRPPVGDTAAYGISNATVFLVNPNFKGYLTFSATNYYGLEAPPYGEISFTVNRVAGSEGSLSVEYATADGPSATNGVDYYGATNILQWDSGDASSRTVTLALINSGVVGTNKQFTVHLFNPQLNDSSDSGLFYPGSSGSITNATMTISNNNSYGSVQFSSTNYLVNEDGGYATITVVRSGGDAGPAYVNYATANGTAVSNANYSATSGTLTFAANQLSASFEVPITNNGLSGPPPSNFYFYVNLSNPVNLTLGTVTNAQVDILNDQNYNQPPGTTNGTFTANINGEVLALAYQTSGQIIAGGSFNIVNGLPEDNLVRLNSNGSVDTSFAASANDTVQAVVNETDNRVLVGGQFTTVDGGTLNYIARLMTDGSVDSSFDIGAGANGAVYSLAETSIAGVPKIYAGGAFNILNSVNSEGIARLNDNGTVDASFNAGSGVDGTVYAIAVYPTNSIYAGDVIIGGSFIHYNGTVVNGIVRLNSNGAMDVDFNPGTAATNGVINAITIQPDGEILVGGSFTNFNGSATTNITRLNDDGSTDNNFAANIAPGANNTVDGIVLQPDNRILVVGQFTQFGGLVRSGVTRLLPTGAADPTINFGTGANGAVDAALINASGSLITLGGAFTAFNSIPANHIIQLYGLSETGSGAFEFSSPGYQVAANGIYAPITILRVGGTSGNVSVNFSTVTNSGTAVPYVDYLPVSTNVAFPPGAVEETVYVPVLTDLAATNNLSVGLLLTNATPPAIITNQPTALLTILNVNSAVSFSSSFTNIFENVAGGVANIAILRQGSTNSACSVNFSTTTNGSAVPGVDFYPTNETITFNPGISQQSAQVLIISNSTLEKTVGMALANPVDAALFTPTNETLTIINSSTSPGQLCFAATNYTVNESAGTATVYVIRTNGFAGTVSYGYATVPGTAQPGVNYQTSSGTVTFNAAATSEPITVMLLTNNPPGGPVSFSIVLTNTTASAATLIAPSNTTVTVVDDITTGVSFVNVTNYFQETNGAVSVFVQRLGNMNSSFSIPFATTNGTALAGVNYFASSGTLNFVPSENKAGILVTLTNREDVTNLTFGIALYPTNTVQLLSPSNTVVVETPAATGLAFAGPTNSILKNGGSIVLPVICLDPSNEPVSVNFATANGTAQAGVDYVPTNGTLAFANGIVTNFVTVGIINNSLIEGQRTFSVNLSNPTPVPPAKLVSPSNEVVTIIDDNSGLFFSSLNYSVNVGGQVSIYVERVDNTNITSTVSFATVAGGSAVPNVDYQPTNGVLTFLPGQITNSFTVNVFGTSAVQPDKTVILELSNPTNGILTPPDVSTLTIYNQNGGDIVPVGVSLARTNGVPNGILQSNQMAYLWFGFRDAGGLNVSSLYATLLSSANIKPTNVVSGGSVETENYGPLTVNGPSASQEFTLTPIGTNGQNVLANFALQVVAVNNTTNYETNSFNLTIGSWTTTFYNTNPIYINAALSYSQNTNATPYPSIITVSNVGDVLVSAAVTLTNFTATSPQAVGVLVVAPELQDTLLMEGIGSADVGANKVTLTFSDAATNSLPESTSTTNPITSGVYYPTNYGAVPKFP